MADLAPQHDFPLSLHLMMAVSKTRNAPSAHPASQGQAALQSWPLRLMRTGFRVLSTVSRPTAVNMAAGMFMKPRRHRPPEWEQELAERGESFEISVQRPPRTDKDTKCPVAARKPALRQLRGRVYDARGGSGSTVLLAHGWEGRGTQLGRLVDPLTSAGHRVVLFDHLGHGESEGETSSVLHMRAGLRAVAERFPDITAVVGHSMGCMATSLVVHEGNLKPERMVFIAPPFRLRGYLGRYVDLVIGVPGMDDEVLQRLESAFDVGWDDLELPAYIHEMSTPLLVLHGEIDQDCPPTSGQQLAEGWPGARFELHPALGHRRILRDPTVIKRAVEDLGPLLTEPVG